MEKQFFRFQDGTEVAVTKYPNGNLEVTRNGVVVASVPGAGVPEGA